jgi:hypothetical protein
LISHIKKENFLRVVENVVLKKIFGFMGEEVTIEWR